MGAYPSQWKVQTKVVATQIFSARSKNEEILNIEIEKHISIRIYRETDLNFIKRISLPISYIPKITW